MECWSTMLLVAVFPAVHCLSSCHRCFLRLSSGLFPAVTASISIKIVVKHLKKVHRIASSVMFLGSLQVSGLPTSYLLSLLVIQAHYWRVNVFECVWPFSPACIVFVSLRVASVCRLFSFELKHSGFSYSLSRSK